LDILTPFYSPIALQIVKFFCSSIPCINLFSQQKQFQTSSSLNSLLQSFATKIAPQIGMYPFNRADTNHAMNATVVVDMDGINSPTSRCYTSEVPEPAAYQRRSNGSTADTESDASSSERHHHAITSRPKANGSVFEEQKNVLADLLEISFSKKSWNFRASQA
jgi:hypothetical protein